jgi:hypothetical protein
MANPNAKPVRNAMRLVCILYLTAIVMISRAIAQGLTCTICQQDEALVMGFQDSLTCNSGAYYKAKDLGNKCNSPVEPGDFENRCNRELRAAWFPRSGRFEDCERVFDQDCRKYGRHPRKQQSCGLSLANATLA